MTGLEKILIIEDELIISTSVCELLEHLGYKNVEIAESIEEGIASLKAKNYDLVLMDVFLGNGLNGIDIISEIQKTKPIPVIYLSGHSDHATLNKAKTTFPMAFLSKPVSETTLKIQLAIFLK
ncbi:hypothetical protein CNR22_04290 [Sphingobacteriaceae bacterium]|nr:hypothetical protein CNR22_04290 [Sphingobacteriaceae bacterium]